MGIGKADQNDDGAVDQTGTRTNVYDTFAVPIKSALIPAGE
jgi:hypothetical protein